jgi:hypothetical protein
MEDLTEGERVTLRDVLDMEIEAFEDAMHRDTDQAPEHDKPKTLEELLERSGSYGETISQLQSIRRKVNDDIRDAGGRTS